MDLLASLSPENVVSLAGAALSSIFAIVSIVYGHRSLALAREAEQRRLPSLICDYEQYVLRHTSENEYLFGFLAVLTNRSETDASILESKLMISYELEGVPTVAIVGTTRNEGHARESPMVSFPLRLDGRQVERGWVFFKVGQGLAERFGKFDEYEVVFTDSVGNNVAFKPRLLVVTT